MSDYNVYFGPIDAPRMDWESSPDHEIDDEELDNTPKSIIGVLGFDPKDIDK